MTQRLQILTDWEHLGDGSPEERSCFAALGIKVDDVWYSEGWDALANRPRTSPYLSAYKFAEWLAWNWWRLRWEPRSASKGWNFAHCISSIGDGYIWPNVTIFSDGQRTALISRASKTSDNTPYRYLANAAAILPSSEFEAAIDLFVPQVLERLEFSDVRGSSLSALWEELTIERRDVDFARVRKVEALLGLQPDELDDITRDAFFACEQEFGEGAVDELAADQGGRHGIECSYPSAVAQEVKESGYVTRPNDAVRLRVDPGVTHAFSSTAAWKVGAKLAKDLREQERLGVDTVLTNKALSELLCVDPAALGETAATSKGVSCLLVDGGDGGRLMLRSKWKTGRRFELARILGDCVVGYEGGMHPATRAYTYRQKVQRAFAAELLSPFNAVMNFLQGDYSPESQADVASHFQVSDMTIRTQLVNHQILDRENLESDAETWKVAA